MARQKTIWKKERGKLGSFSPLLGSWITEVESSMGKYTCTRVLEPVLGGNYLQLTVKWHFPKSIYEEHAIIGIFDGKLSFWSFTSDGKNSRGIVADGKDINPEAICFGAQMPAGLARMIYWPNMEGGFNWAVESKNKKGWNRFMLHHYKALK